MESYNIIKDVPLWVPLALSGALVTGMVVHTGMLIYRKRQSTNAHFKELQQNYKNDFSKEELVSFYKELVVDVRPGLWGKQKKAATKMSEDLEGQIIAYSQAEVMDALNNGAQLDETNPFLKFSDTYKNTLGIFKEY